MLLYGELEYGVLALLYCIQNVRTVVSYNYSVVQVLWFLAQCTFLEMYVGDLDPAYHHRIVICASTRRRIHPTKPREPSTMLRLSGRSSTMAVYRLLLLAPIRSYSLIPILYDSSNNLHRDMNYHPEQPARIDACIEALQPLDFIQLQDVSLQSPDGIRNAAFSQSELRHARDMLVEAHSEEFVSNLEQKCTNSKQRRIDEGRSPLGFVGYIDDDTYVTTETFDVCL